MDHLENTKGFNLRALKFLILDEADRMLSMDFEEEINKILEVIPRERTTMLFSATMTTKVRDGIEIAVCLSVRLSVRSSVRQLVRPPVGASVRPSVCQAFSQSVSQSVSQSF